MATFHDIIGQEQIKEHLQNAISAKKISMLISSTVKNPPAKNLLPEYLP